MSKTYTGFRILEYDRAKHEFKTLFHALNGTRVIEPDKWLKAKRSRVSDGSGKRKYISGFHILPTFHECLAYSKKFKRKEGRVIAKVMYKGARRKQHSSANVILADFMKLVLTDSWVSLNHPLYE